MEDLKRQWNDACKAVGLIAIGHDTAAKLLAIVYVLGGEREAFVFNAKMNADLDYIREVYGFHGGDTPDIGVTEPMKKYVRELERCGENYPNWAKDMMKDLYNINL